MRTFKVGGEWRVYFDLDVEANNAEEAEQKVRDIHASGTLSQYISSEDEPEIDLCEEIEESEDE